MVCLWVPAPAGACLFLGDHPSPLEPLTRTSERLSCSGVDREKYVLNARISSGSPAAFLTSRHLASYGVQVCSKRRPGDLAARLGKHQMIGEYCWHP